MVLPLLIGGALGALGTAVAGNKAAKAQTQAADGQTQIAREQMDMARQFRNEDIQRFSPYANAGQQALSTYQNQLGTNYESSPFANHLLTQGRDQIEAGAAARGGLFSGANAVALDNHRTGVIAADRDNWLNRQASLMQGGQAAAGLQANISSSGANAMYGAMNQQSNALANQGNALAANYTNQNNAFQNLLGQGAQAYGYMKGPMYGA